jgi:hypothetical protein
MEGSAPSGLRFGVDDEPGIRRHGHKRPTYINEASGRPVHDKKVLDRIKHLAVPPAWSDVWIASDPRSHVQATGRMPAGASSIAITLATRPIRRKEVRPAPSVGHVAAARRQVDRDPPPRSPHRVIAALVEPSIAR